MNFLIIISSFLCIFIVSADEILVMNEYTYLFSVPQMRNWYSAYQYCRFWGMYLIDIPNPMEHSRVVSLINELDAPYKTAEYWTSGTDIASDGSNVWMSTGFPFIYTNWHNGQPDSIFNGANERENCVELRYWGVYKWNDHTCSTEKYFICRNETIFKPMTLPSNP